jgi:hypothetical protein
MTDDEIFVAFEAGKLSPKIFSHEMHIHVGWIYVCRFPRAEAIARFASKLKAWATALKIAGKYHETITWFFMLLISERQAAQQATSFKDFIAANQDMITKKPSILDLYYKPETLKSQVARQQYLLPDQLKAVA